MTSHFATWLSEGTIYGSVLLCLILVLRPIIRKYAGSSAANFLWFALLVRLLLPWAPDSPWHYSNAPGETNARTQIKVTVHRADGAVEKPSVAVPGQRREEPVFSVISIYFLGVVLCAFLTLVRIVRAGRLATAAHEITHDPRIKEASIFLPPGFRPKIKVTGALKSPALAGILHPVILLPKNWEYNLSTTQLKCIFLHEAGHWRRGDIFWQFGFLFARTLHWFNPLVWWADRLAETDREIACDEWVMNSQQGVEADEYAETLFRIAAAPLLPTSPTYALMARRGGSLRPRISHLGNHRARGIWTLGLASILVAICLVITGPIRAEEKPEPIAEVPPKPAASPNLPLEPKPGKVIEIESKLLEFGESNAGTSDLIQKLELDRVRQLQPDDLAKLMLQLSKIKDADVMSAPTVACQSGQAAKVEIIREFRFPSKFDPPNGMTPATPKEFEVQNVGFQADVTPTLNSKGEIELEVSSTVTVFAGFINYGPTADQVINQPVFEKRVFQTALTIKDGETAIIGGILAQEQLGKSAPIADRIRQPDLEAQFKSGGESKQKGLYLIFTARIIEKELSSAVDKQSTLSGLSGIPSAGPLPTSATIVPPPPAVTSKVPAAIVEPGTTGFFKSPYAPNSGHVDLRGFPSGTEVKCPYTGKIFVVP